MSRLYILNGHDKGQSFEMREGDNFIGRSSENDFMIKDNTVSRRHLKIIKRGERHFIVDLKSMNRTFFNGNFLPPGIEIEVKEGIPIVIGMSAIGIGYTCRETVAPFLDSIGLTKEVAGDSGISAIHHNRTNQKKLELVYKVMNVLAGKKPINEALDRILLDIFELLKGIDRGAFVLIDPMKKKITDVVSRSNRPTNQKQDKFCKPLVKHVLIKKKPLAISNVKAEKNNELIDTLKLMRIESVMCTPLIACSELMGVLYVDSQERPYGFSKEDLSLFVDLSQRIAFAWQEVCFLSL